MTRRMYIAFGVVLLIGLTTGCASSKDGSGGAEIPPADAAVAPVADTPATAPTDGAEDEEPILNRLKWSTATEVDNFGFDVYRSTSEDGPFERITKQALPGAGTVDEPQYYKFEDTEIDPTRDYYYYVESIAMDGTRERFSPIIKARAKRPVEKGETEGSEAAP